MASIEDRIVQMQFDNTAFERKMSTTIQSLEKLNTTLATAGQRNGLENIAHAARGFNLAPMASAVEGISAKFLALSTVAITAISNIVNRAVDAGIRIAKAFTIEPLTQGFQEYETQIGSIQTILANTAAEGTNLTQVNAALDELNTYADRTIYNFSEMARNIGTFTAAGVDLDTSVTSIQGIANLAAISGSSAEQASVAMYQLSQGISAGVIRLQDWNSVVNAGMGGQVFQKALFDTAVAMGTITDVPVGTSFEEWTDAGNTFRGSLEDGWLTADVLTTTLGAFSGEMTEAQLVAAGFTEEMAQDMLALGDIGVDAATKVRTASQLFNTIKEAVSSGWAQSFRIVVGDFEEATALFTRISDSIGGFVSRNADARNALLQTWKDMGGRERLIWAFESGFKSLRIAMKPLRDAFREVFPPMTANRLVDLTKAFGMFMVRIRPGTQTLTNMKKIFEGFFSALKIGWTVLKEGVGFVVNLFKALTGAGGGGFLTFLGKIGEGISNFRKTLVDQGGIAKFFDGLTESLQRPIQIMDNFKTHIRAMLHGIGVPRGLLAFVNSVKMAFENLFSGFGGAAGRIGDIWAPLRNGISGLGQILSSAWDLLSDFFSGLGDRIGSIFGSDAFSGVLDTIDTGLLGGIAVLIAKFLGGGLNLDFGGGLFGNISQSFEELTGVLGAMQTSLKASALLKIAAAVGILAVSLALLASIDPDKMSDALATLAIGFGQLLGAFAILNKLDLGVKSAATMNLIATAMLIMAGAVLVLSAAVKVFSTMSWEELAKGLVGVAGAMAILVGASILLSKFSGSMIRAGVGMLAIAVALGIMAGVVKLFSMMEWEEMAKGLVGVAGALAAVAIGMRLMPKGIMAQGVGLLLIATSLNILYLAVRNFATLDWESMGKGLVGITGALLGIGVAVRLMPATLPLIGAGLLLVSGSLLILGKVMENLASMSWEDIAKGLIGIAGALGVISLAMMAASGSALGAASITVMAFAIQMLADTLQDVGRMSWGSIIKGFVGIAGALAILGLASLALAPVIPAMLGLGAALLLIGGAVALAGVGILAIAKAFELLARLGARAAEVLINALLDLAAALPDVLKGIADGILSLVSSLLDGLPGIISQLGKVLSAILDELVELIPKAGEVIRTFITEMLATARELFPDVVQTGFDLILALLKGIRDNIGEIVTVVADIITEFLDALALKIPEVIDSAYNFFVAVVEGVVAKLVDVGQLLVPKGIEMIKGLLRGIDENKGEIADFFISLPGKILGWLGDVGGWLLSKGWELLQSLYTGASNFVTETLIPWLGSLPSKAWGWIGATAESLVSRGRGLIIGLVNGAVTLVNEKLIPWLGSLPGKAWNWLGNTVESLVSRGRGLIVGLVNGAVTIVNEKLIPWLGSLPGKAWTWVGNTLSSLVSRGRGLIVGFLNAAVSYVNSDLIPWLGSLPSKAWHWIGSTLSSLVTRGRNLIEGLVNGAVAVVNESLIPWLSSFPSKIRSWIGAGLGTLYQIGRNILTGLWNGMKSVWNDVTGWLGGLAGKIVGLKGPPEKDAVLLEPVGNLIFQGLHTGMMDEWDVVARWLSQLNPADNMQEDLGTKMSRVVSAMAEQLSSMDEFNPVITPVLDLSLVRQGATELSGMFSASSSYSQAARIAATAAVDNDAATSADAAAMTEIRFEQNNYSPKALSTGDIYRQTRSQIAMAKEELAIP